jgi:putative glutamine amidotransferase
MHPTKGSKPLIGLPTDTFANNGLLQYSSGDKYARAVSAAAGGLPILLPALDQPHDLRATLKQLHGVLITGAPSNVHPSFYHSDGVNAEPYDERRDAASLSLIEIALEEKIPLLAICRGIQELNVVMGGTLAHNVHQAPGNFDHLGNIDAAIDIRYGPRHTVQLAPEGILATLFDDRELLVNSIHRQAIARISDRLHIEATADDGVIEAVSVKGASTFALGVQWHPEFDVANNAHSQSLFAAFGRAALARMQA